MTVSDEATGDLLQRLRTAALGMAAALSVWGLWPRAPFHAVVWGAFLVALIRRPRGPSVWRSASGIVFVALALWMAATAAWSLSPAKSLRSFALLLPAIAGAFALPVLFAGERPVARVAVYSAAGVAVLLGADLIRLWLRLGRRLAAEARITQPYVLNHPNVACIMAGAAAIVLLAFAWSRRRDPSAAVPAVLGVLVSLAYLLILASRGPQIAFAAAVGCAGFLAVGWRRKLAWAAALAAAGALLLVFAPRINERFRSADLRSFNERDRVWAHTWDLARERPVLGHGLGKGVFEDVYYSSDPPASRYRFPHPHGYWLMALFESGWIGVGLHAAAWGLLGARLLRRLHGLPTFEQRVVPGTALLLLVLVHVYGLADYPDEAVRLLQVWLVPASLVVSAGRRIP